MKAFSGVCSAFLITLAVAGIPRAHGQLDALNSVQSLDYAFLGGGTIAIKIAFKNELHAPPRVFTTYHPATRIVLEFANMHSKVGREPIQVRRHELLSLQVVRSGRRTRVIIRLLSPMIRETESTGNELLIMLRRPYLQ